jgi:hypothetical protein
MSQKIQATLPDPAAHQLHQLAAGVGEAPATLAGHMLRQAIAHASQQGHVKPTRHTPIITAAGPDDRPDWLQPYGGDPEWRATMWGEIVALHARYPRHLSHLKDGWWNDDSHTETLCALATWRAQLDDAAEDPREELAFQTQLHDYAQTLRGEGGSVSKTWKPEAPPNEWAAP